MVQMDETRILIYPSARTAYKSLEKNQKKKSLQQTRKRNLNKAISAQRQKFSGISQLKNGSISTQKVKKPKSAESKNVKRKSLMEIGHSADKRPIKKIKIAPVLIENDKNNKNSAEFQHNGKGVSQPVPEKFSNLDILQIGNKPDKELQTNVKKHNRPTQVMNTEELNTESLMTAGKKASKAVKKGKKEKRKGDKIDSGKYEVGATTSMNKNAKSRKQNLDLTSGTLESFIAEKYKGFHMSNNLIGEDSQVVGLQTFAKMIDPVTTSDFFKQHWEKSHLVIRATDRKKFSGLLSTSDIDNILRMNKILYTKNIDVTSYKDGVRQTHNPEGRATAANIWDFYKSGCSVRMLNPQTFHLPVWRLLATLQEYFNSFCGANVYLTPPGTQGFAPHWDDIEAFILQLEGKKRWRVYGPRNVKEELPRYSSGNFGPDDRLGPSLLDCVLEPGDVLYFPRGFIHQGEALPDTHSLHITISTFQKNAWVDLLEKLLPAALAAASEEDVAFRAGLPIGYLQCGGVAISDVKSRLKEAMKEKATKLVHKMMEFAPIDATIDQMAKGFIHDSLPPLLTDEEKKRTVFEGDSRWCANARRAKNGINLALSSPIRLLRRGCVRLVIEENTIRLYNTIENSREYHEDEPQYIEIYPDVAEAVEFLIKKYPKYVHIKTLPLPTSEDKMAVARGLWEKGIIRIL